MAVCGTASASAQSAANVEARQLTANAEGMLWLGLAEHGRVQEFTDALVLLDRADELLAETDAQESDSVRLGQQIEALREDLTLNLEYSRRRFFGAFPLARLAHPVVALARQDDITETMHLEAGNVAVKRATERVEAGILSRQYPHVVLRSVPRNRAYENVAMRAFAKANRPFARSRIDLVGALTAEGLAAYDRGDFDADIAPRIMEALGAAKLVIVTIREAADIPDGTVVVLGGAFFETGSDAQTDSFAHMGFSRSRRDQVSRILWAHLGLLLTALVCAVRTRWNQAAPWPMTQRLAMGGALFVGGRIFASVAVMALRGVIPRPDAAATSAWWWAAVLGLVVVLGSGILAWIAQARLSGSVIGSRTSRAVGMIFALAALGACAYFVEPLLLLDPDAGPAVFAPFLLASVTLATLMGYAARTGPPVPRYFLLGPICVVPVVGVALFAMSSGALWGTVGLSGLLCAVAVARHRYAVAHGFEEEEDDDEAERLDRERLDKLGRDIERKLPI